MEQWRKLNLAYHVSTILLLVLCQGESTIRIP